MKRMPLHLTAQPAFLQKIIYGLCLEVVRYVVVIEQELREKP